MLQSKKWGFGFPGHNHPKPRKVEHAEALKLTSVISFMPYLRITPLVQCASFTYAFQDIIVLFRDLLQLI